MNNPPILVIGDSHCRTFCNNVNFIPLFIGPGKKNCFISNLTTRHLERNLWRILNDCSRHQPIIFCFGEPDTRYYLGKGWKPWLSEKKNVTDNVEQKISASFARYSRLISSVIHTFEPQLYVLSVFPSPRISQNLYVREFNRLLRNYITEARHCHFIDIEEPLMDSRGCLKQEYRADPVHTKESAQHLVEKELINKGVIERVPDEKVQIAKVDPPKFISNNCVFDEKFKCYRQKKRSSLIQKLKAFKF